MRTYPHLNKIFSLFKPAPIDWDANDITQEGSHSSKRKKYFEEGRVKDIVDIVFRSMPYIAHKESRLKIIDLGCGFGEFSTIFRTFGHDVFSVNGGDSWYLDDFRYVCEELLDLNYGECNLFDLNVPLNTQYDIIFASEILTLASLSGEINKVLKHLLPLTKKLVIICHKDSLPNYDRTLFSPDDEAKIEIHRAVADNFNIITFYSDERYKELADHLIQSGKYFGYYPYACPIKNVKSWGKAVSEKPRLIKKYYHKFGPPLLYLDADCEIVADLNPLLKLMRENDLCIRQRNLKDKYNLGVMGFGTRVEKLFPLLEEWTQVVKSSLEMSITVDQKPLEALLQKQYKHLKVYPLPAHYNFLPADDLEYNKSRAKILHHKESKSNPYARAWRNKLNHQER